MFSLRMLIAMVTLSAVYIAGMAYRTAWWEASILTLTYLIFAASIAAALLSRDRRAFFVVLSTFGWAYCVCVYLGLELVTSKALAAIAERFVDPVVTPASDKLVVRLTHGDGLVVRAEGYDRAGSTPSEQSVDELIDRVEQTLIDNWETTHTHVDTFEKVVARMKTIGHAFFAVVLGLISGAIAEAVVRRSKTNGSTVAK